MMALEETYFSMAEKCTQNVLIIADRGVMDASAFISRENWEKILAKLNLEDIEISDNRYHQVVHMQVIKPKCNLNSIIENKYTIYKLTVFFIPEF